MLSVGWCSESHLLRKTNNEERAFSISTLVLIGLAVVATIIQIVAERWTNIEGELCSMLK